MHALCADTIKDVVQNITEGCNTPSQHFMYFIYKKYESNVPIVGTRFDTYKYAKTITGKYVSKPNTNCHEYALCHNSSSAWFFTDKPFE